MNKGYIEFAKQKTTELRRPPQVKSSKTQIYTKFHKIPEIKFEERQLTSFSGILIFQILFNRLEVKNKLKKCSFPFKTVAYYWASYHCASADRPSDPGFQKDQGNRLLPGRSDDSAFNGSKKTAGCVHHFPEPVLVG